MYFQEIFYSNTFASENTNKECMDCWLLQAAPYGISKNTKDCLSMSIYLVQGKRMINVKYSISCKECKWKFNGEIKKLTRGNTRRLVNKKISNGNKFKKQIEIARNKYQDIDSITFEIKLNVKNVEC